MKNIRQRIVMLSIGVLIGTATIAFAATFTKFSPATGILKGSASTYVTTAATGADIPAAGSNTQLQYNNSGVLGASSSLTFTSASNVLNLGAATTPGTFSVGQLDTMVVNGVSVPIPGFALNSNIQGVIENHSYVSGSATGGARYYGARSRGTISAPTIVQSGDNLSSFYAVGYNGTAYSLAGQLLFSVGNTPGATDMPGDFDILLSPDGSQTPTSRLKVFNTGAIGISGSQGTSGQCLTSNGTGAAASWTACAASGGGSSGTFTATYTTGFTVSQTQDFQWYKIGNLVTITPTTQANGTSNAITLSTSAGDLPAAIRPTSSNTIITTQAYGQDNGATKALCMRIATDGTIAWGIWSATGNICGFNTWTASGTKLVGNGVSGIGQTFFTYGAP